MGVVGLVGLMLRPEYYRQNALDCLRQATTTSDPHCKAVLLDMAIAWRRLANQTESFRGRSCTHLALVSDRTTRESAYPGR